MENTQTGNFPLRGIDRHAWNAFHESDLIALRRRETGDTFSRWFINIVIPWFHEIIGHKIKARDFECFPYISRAFSLYPLFCASLLFSLPPFLLARTFTMSKKGECL